MNPTPSETMIDFANPELVPAHWVKRKLSRSFLRIGSGATPESGLSKYHDNGTINWVNTGDLNDGDLYSCQKKVTEQATTDYTALKLHPSGSLIIAMYGATIAKTGIIHFPAVTNQACCVLTDSETIDNKFLQYWFFHQKEIIISMATGGGQPNISQDTIRQLNVFCPDISEQRLIVRFLNAQASLIDQIIEKKKRLLELLQEQRQSIITEAVTKGIRPNVPMKDSGIPWMGEVPEHWEIVKLRYLLDSRLQYGANEAAELEDRNLPRYIRITDFGENGRLRENTFRSLPHEAADGYMLKTGDVLFARSGATVGKTFIFEQYDGEACFAGYLIKASTNDRLISKYLYFYTKSIAYQNWKDSIFDQATIQNISAEKYNNLPVPTPPSIEEQLEIISFIEAQDCLTSEVMEKVEAQIEKIKEYRQSLISEAVTGRIDVRDWKPATA